MAHSILHCTRIHCTGGTALNCTEVQVQFTGVGVGENNAANVTGLQPTTEPPNTGLLKLTDLYLDKMANLHLYFNS